MSAKEKQLVEEIAAEADKSQDQPMPAGVVASRPNKSVPIAVRLAPDDVAAIEALASQLGIPISTLVRGWILTALKSHREESFATAIDRLAADVQRLRELAA